MASLSILEDVLFKFIESEMFRWFSSHYPCSCGWPEVNVTIGTLYHEMDTVVIFKERNLVRPETFFSE